MEAALYDPEFGYYHRRDLQRWGREADYRTSAERSELFAATFARYFARIYDELGQPAQWTIVEGGAGDGRFAQRVLRAFAEQHPRVFAATRYEQVEISSASEPHDAANPCLYFSNELLDAFPVHVVTKDQELYVTVDSDDTFVWTEGPFSTPRIAEYLEEYSIKPAPAQVVEVNLAIDNWFEGIARKLKPRYVITVDYGAEATELYDAALRPRGTLRAFSRHQFVDNVLSAPGEYDITSSVNWSQVKRAGERLGFAVVKFASQDKFLLEAGLLDELSHRLTRIDDEAGKLALTTDAREMILPGGMASSFQVLVQKRV